MATLSRIKRILEATIRDLMESARDPELELAHFVEEVELGLGEVRAEMETARIRRDRTAGQLAEHRRSAAEWMARAEQASARDEDDLARGALLRHRSALEEAEYCEEQLAEDELALANLRKDENALEVKLREAQLEQKRLSARLRRAEAEKKASSVVIGSDRPAEGAQRMRERIVKTEAESEAAREVHGESLEAQFAATKRRPTLDEELAELKRRVGKAKDEKSP